MNAPSPSSRSSAISAAFLNPLRRISRIPVNTLFIIAIVLLVVTGGASVYCLQKLNHAAETRVFIKDLDNCIDDLLIALLNIETGHRGFALTGDPDYLEPNQIARKNVEERISIVRELIGDNAAQQQRLAGLEALIQEKLIVSDRIVQARETLGLEAAQKIVATQRGKEIMDEARQIVAVMVAELDEWLTLTNEDARNRRALMQIALAFVIGCAVLLLLGAFVLYNREHDRRSLSEEKFGRVVEAAPSALVMVGPAGRLLLVNAQAEKLFGYKREELLGQPVELLVPERFRAAHPGHRGNFFAQPKARGMGEGRDLFGLHKDGREVPVEIGLNPMITHEGTFVLASIINITERKRSEALLKESESRLSDLFDNTTDLIQSVSPEGKFLFVNPTWHRVLGYSGADLETMTAFDVIAPESLDHCRELFGKVMSGQPVDHIQARFRAKDGRIIEVEGNASCQIKNGQPTATRAIFHDVTERQQREAAMNEINTTLVRQTAELAHEKNRAQAADRLKSAFLATMSHELRTPLNSIIGFTGLILQQMAGPLTPEQSKQLEMVRGSARHLLALINDVLDISKIEAGQLEVDCQPFDLRDSITTVMDTVRPLAEKKGLALKAEVAAGVAEMESDKRRVEQVLLNLLSNAVKFTERGSVTLRAEIVPDTLRPPPSALRISVTDTGMGIKAENLKDLFQPFRQIDSGLSRNHDGTGLGLAICKKLVEKLGGEITVQSQPGQGSTFAFTLPLDQQ